MSDTTTAAGPTSASQVRRVGVVGAGTMGLGIAQVFAQAGFDVLLHDTSTAALDRARQGIEKSLGKFVEKGKLAAAERDATLGAADAGRRARRARRRRSRHRGDRRGGRRQAARCSPRSIG